MSVRSVACGCLLALLTGCATIPPPTTPEGMLKEGDRLAASGQFEEAVNQWKKVREGDYSPELVTQADLKIADAQFADEKYIEAAASYENFRKLHPTHEQAPYALYRLGLCYYREISGIDTEQTPVRNAVTVFEDFLRQYPTSEYAGDVRAKLEECRTKQLQHEVYVGKFYFRTGKHGAAIKRLEEALVQFPKAQNDEALFYLGSAYLKSGDKAKGEQVLNRLIGDYPASTFAGDAKKLLK